MDIKMDINTNISVISLELKNELLKIGTPLDEINSWWTFTYEDAPKMTEKEMLDQESDQLKILLDLRELGKELKISEDEWLKMLRIMNDKYSLFGHETWVQYGSEPYDELNFDKDENIRNKFRRIMSVSCDQCYKLFSEKII